MKFKFLTLIYAFGMLLSSILFAEEVSNLVQFKSNTTAKSSEVNQNFNTIKDAVNDNNSRIGTLEQFKNDMESPKIRAVTYHASCFAAVSNPNLSVPRTYASYQYLQDKNNMDNFNFTHCPITLPEGSKILKIIAQVYDSTGDVENIQILLDTPGLPFISTGSSNAGYQNLEIDLTNGPVIIEGGITLLLTVQYSSDTKGPLLGLKAVTVYYEYDPTYSSTLP